ncbi:MAG: methyltransferase domain-containing protein [Rhodomicrobium sp.]
MEREHELGIVRRAFAKHVMAEAMVNDGRIEAAFAQVPREDFLGPGPWTMPRWPGVFVTTPAADPVYLYVDNVVQIIAERCLNNGHPSSHALWIAAAAITKGEHVVHVGAGTGYYTAILAHLTGESGKVTAIELDPDLAGRTKANLASFANVRVWQGNGFSMPFDAADVIYVNAGVTRPADTWLDSLKEGGRLILPLTTNESFPATDIPKIPKQGAMFRIERRLGEFVVQWISSVTIIPCEGGRDVSSELALALAFARGGWQKVTRLHRTSDLPADRCWLRALDWCLTYD